MKHRVSLFWAAVMLVFGVLVPVSLAPSATANVKPGPPVGQWQPMYALHPMSTGNSVQGYGYASRCLTILDQNANPAWSHVNQWPCDQPFGQAYNNGGRPRWWLYGNTAYPGYYQVVNEHNGICLDVTYSSQAPGAQVIGYYCSNQANQMFSKVDIGNGTFALVAAHSNQCLTLDDWGNAHWATLLQDYCNFSPQTLRRQAWTANGPNDPNNADMVAGYIDSLGFNSDGISISGWALTPQAPAQPLGVRVTVNGTVVTPGGMRYIGWGNIGPTSRPDVNSYWNWGYHNESGFDFDEYFPWTPGPQTVCLQAQSWGFYDTVGCQTVFVNEASGTPTDLPEIKWPRNAAPTNNATDSGYGSTYQVALNSSIDRIQGYSGVNLQTYKALGRVGCPLVATRQQNSGVWVGGKTCASGMANTWNVQMSWSVPPSYGTFTYNLAVGRFVVNWRHFVAGSSTTQDERDAVIAHEIAHLVYPSNSELLTDCQARKWMGNRGPNAYFYYNRRPASYLCPA